MHDEDYYEGQHDPFDINKPVRIRWLGVPIPDEPEFHDMNAGEAAEWMDLSAEEIEWAIEEYGRCDTENWVCWQPSERNGEEYPTAEAPAPEDNEEAAKQYREFLAREQAAGRYNPNKR